MGTGINMATYVHNRTITEVLEGLTLYEARCGMEPGVTHFRAPCAIEEQYAKLKKLDNRVSMYFSAGTSMTEAVTGPGIQKDESSLVQRC